ncbi:MAG: hypothetical protein JWP76_4264 [Dactylosporangium sp.]|nr:hypothetical protein [Dactylosporangium sp.]
MFYSVGTLVTLELPPDSPVLVLPWIITFGPLSDDEEWEPVVCGPYEHAHAMALAESVVADEELMAVVEPLQPHVSIDQIRGDIAAARLAAEGDDEPDFPDDGYVPSDIGYAPAGGEESTVTEPTPPPSPEQVRAGFVRVAARLTGRWVPR